MCGPPVCENRAVVQKVPVITQILKCSGIMSHKQYRCPACRKPAYFLETACLKHDIANRQRFVDDQNRWFDTRRDCECKAYYHPAAIRLDWLLDELADIGEGGDIIKAPGHLFARDAEDRAVEKDILAAGKLGVEAAAELEQRRNAPTHIDAALAGGQCTGDHLQQRALAATIAADDPHRLAAPYLERDAAHRPVLVAVLAAKTVEQHVLQAVLWLAVDPVHLADIAHTDDYLGGVRRSRGYGWRSAAHNRGFDVGTSYHGRSIA